MAARVADLPTPAALVDVGVVERNCARMAGRMTALGVRLRPHVKTHKCREVARLSVRGHFGGITVSTLAEARFFGDAGFDDITYAVPLAPGRAEEAAGLGARLGRLSVIVDDDIAIDALVAVGEARAHVFPVLLKVDCGYHRAGVDPAGEDALRIARRLTDSPWTDFRGLLAHGGHSYAARDREEIIAVAAEERDATVACAERLRAAGLEVGEVSIGSTPTMALATDLQGATEARPGNYTFFDGFQAAIGSCAAEDVALNVLTTVIGCHAGRGQAIIDAGALALSKDPGAQHVSGWRGGFGALCDAESGALLSGVCLHSLSQEHGLVRAAAGEEQLLRGLRVGTKLRVVPNHACLTAALFDRYHVVRGGKQIDEWRPCRGW